MSTSVYSQIFFLQIVNDWNYSFLIVLCCTRVLTLHSMANGHPSLCLFRLASNASSDFPVGGSDEKTSLKKREKNHKKSANRRPETPASLSWSLETTRQGHEIHTNSIWRKLMKI